MRSRVGILAVAALAFALAPAGFAQQSNTSGTDSSSASTTTSVSTTTGLHGTPTPFPAQPATPRRKRSAARTLNPERTFRAGKRFLAIPFLTSRRGPVITGTEKMNGGSTSLAYYLNHWFGLEFDFSGYHTGTLNFGDGGNQKVDASGFTYMGGPKFAYRNNTRFTPFAQVLFGAAHGNVDMLETAAAHTAFAMSAGGGLDIGVTKHVSWRIVDTEYLFSDFNIPDGSTHQNNIRISSGLLFNWGAHPEIVNRNPMATCSADKNSVTAGSGENVPVHASASDPDGDTLTYTWVASGGRVDGTGADAQME